ncbi:helix-turn-helix transcriptional regulator [Photobacterium kasasachensis]|uniref:helix-turn-helix transcriptional regulator n=1 Tax=Photobacterium kasasachensis TaxID=2910240 RepID=UPI003D1267FF
MCSANTAVSLPTLSQEMPAPLESDSFIELQPGLAVCISHSNTMCLTDAFPSDKDYIHLNCILKGGFRASVKDASIHLLEGDSIMGFSDGEMFHLINSPAFSNLDVMVTPQLLASLAGPELVGMDLGGDIPFFIKGSVNHQKVKAAAMQISSLAYQQPQCKLLLHSAVLDFIYWQLTAITCPHSKTRLSAREKHQLETAREYLLRDLSLAPTIADISNAVGLNQCKLKKGFKTLYGNSIYAHFQAERMKKARQLLRDNNVTETAMILGYSNVSHFSAAFRKQFNIQPRDARKEAIPSLSIGQY